MCLAEGQKEQDAATAAAAKDQARKRKAVGERCACDICGKKYYVFRYVTDVAIATSKFKGERLVNAQRHRVAMKKN